MVTGKIELNNNLLLIFILALGLVLRLQGIANPLLDDQAWRQADTATMAWHMQGNLLEFPEVFYPKLSYDGTSPQQVELEFPLFPYLLAWTWQFTGQQDIWGRLWAIGFSLASILGIYYLGKRLFGQVCGLVAAFIYALLPLSVYYGRVIMPEPLTQTLAIWALNAILRWRDKPSYPMLLTAALLMAGAILTKLPQLMVLPVALVWGFYRLDIDSKQAFYLPVYLTVAIGLPAAYYFSAHIQSNVSGQFVSGIIRGQVLQGHGFWKDLSVNFDQGLTYPVGIFAFLSLILLIYRQILRPKQDGAPLALYGLYLWTFISVVYLIVVCARIPLDYYLVPILPPLALAIGTWLKHWEKWKRLLLVIVLGIVLIKEGNSTLMQKLAWDERYLIQAEWIKHNTDPSSILILSDPPPMTFYYSQRVGFRLIDTDENSLRQLSALPGDYLVRSPISSRSEQFWLKIEENYPEVGPGVYQLNKNSRR